MVLSQDNWMLLFRSLLNKMLARKWITYWTRELAAVQIKPPQLTSITHEYYIGERTNAWTRHRFLSVASLSSLFMMLPQHIIHSSPILNTFNFFQEFMTNEDLTYDQYTPYCGRGRLGGLLLFCCLCIHLVGLQHSYYLLHLICMVSDI